MKMFSLFLAFVLLGGSAFQAHATSESGQTSELRKPNNDLDPSKFVFEEVANGFNLPIFITQAGDGSGRIFIAEKAGLIKILKNGSVLSTPFLDIRSLVKSDGNEQGLLSFAFHPSYSTNGKFYVVYNTDRNGDSVGSNLILEQFTVSGGDPDQADPNSGVVLLTIGHPGHSNHNGGTLAFGADGYLYWSIGDGGGAGDPDGNAQNLNRLLGKMLRLNVDVASPYVPGTNPYSGNANLNTRYIWAYGLRNPWRFSFDRLTGDMYIGDVGQNTREEIDFQSQADINIENSSTHAVNYGWSVLEGSLCYNPPSGCSTSGKVPPVAQFDHSIGWCAITGGYVYRGSKYPALQGKYFFSDYCSNELYSLYKNINSTWTKTFIANLPSSSTTTFGEDEDGNLYFNDYNNGKIYEIKYQDTSVYSIVSTNSNPTNASSVDFTVSFSEPVTGVDTSDFSLTTSGVSGTSITGVSGSGSTYTVSVNSGTGDGTIRLDITDDDSIMNLDANPLGGVGTGNGDFSSGETYTIDRTIPTISSISRSANSPSALNALSFIVTFSEPVIGVDTSDFSLSTTGVTNASIISIVGSGSSRTVTVNTGIGDGSIRLDLIDDDSISDLASNPLGGSGSNDFTSGETYAINKPDLPAPLLRSPRNSFLTNDTTPTFWWSAVKNSQSYEVQFASDSAFTSIVGTNSSSSLSDTPASPFSDGTYFWRVRALNASSQPGAWSTARSFTIDTTGPSAPTLLSPFDTVSLSKTPTFKWSAVSGAVSYEFQYDNDSDFSSPSYDATQRGTSRKPPVIPPGTYSWRVRARDSLGNWSNWSAVFAFIITP